MSEYIKTLVRLRNAQATEPNASPSESWTPVPAAAVPSSVAAATAQAYKTLYDNLRLAVAGETHRRVVLAGADASEATALVANGLEDYIRTLGFRVLRVELCLVQGRPILRRRREQSLASLSSLGLEFAADLKPLDLSSHAAQVEVTQWLAAASRLADMVLVQGCALSESVDAALLARSCDGLMIVAHAGVTERSTLAAAAERARAAGCRVLGLVLFGIQQPLPAWLRRLLRSRRSSRIEDR